VQSLPHEQVLLIMMIPGSHGPLCLPRPVLLYSGVLPIPAGARVFAIDRRTNCFCNGKGRDSEQEIINCTMLEALAMPICWCLQRCAAKIPNVCHAEAEPVQLGTSCWPCSDELGTSPTRTQQQQQRHPQHRLKKYPSQRACVFYSCHCAVLDQVEGYVRYSSGIRIQAGDVAREA
jgi:hypothetical protein